MLVIVHAGNVNVLTDTVEKCVNVTIEIVLHQMVSFVEVSILLSFGLSFILFGFNVNKSFTL